MATPIITADTPAVKPADATEVDVGLLSTQFRRRSARAFVAALAAGLVANTPTGCRIEPSERHGAEVVTPDGARYPVSGRWVAARLLDWWDSLYSPDARREYRQRNWKIEQVGRKWAAEVAEWIAADVWLAADSQVSTATVAASRPTTSDK